MIAAGARGLYILIKQEKQAGRIPNRYYGFAIVTIYNGVGLLGVAQALRLLLLIYRTVGHFSVTARHFCGPPMQRNEMGARSLGCRTLAPSTLQRRITPLAPPAEINAPRGTSGHCVSTEPCTKNPSFRRPLLASAGPCFYRGHVQRPAAASMCRIPGFRALGASCLEAHQPTAACIPRYCVRRWRTMREASRRI